MMAVDGLDEFRGVVDCAGLHAIVNASGNLKGYYINLLSSGALAVPSCVWSEFKELFEDEAEMLEVHVARKINMKKSYQIGAAAIADQLNSGFSRGPYDSETDLYTASIACAEGVVVLTAESQLSSYEGVECEVFELQAWAEQ